MGSTGAQEVGRADTPLSVPHDVEDPFRIRPEFVCMECINHWARPPHRSFTHNFLRVHVPEDVVNAGASSLTFITLDGGIDATYTLCVDIDRVYGFGETVFVEGSDVLNHHGDEAAAGSGSQEEGEDNDNDNGSEEGGYTALYRLARFQMFDVVFPPKRCLTYATLFDVLFTLVNSECSYISRAFAYVPNPFSTLFQSMSLLVPAIVPTTLRDFVSYYLQVGTSIFERWELSLALYKSLSLVRAMLIAGWLDELDVVPDNFIVYDFCNGYVGYKETFKILPGTNCRPYGLGLLNYLSEFGSQELPRVNGLLGDNAGSDFSHREYSPEMLRYREMWEEDFQKEVEGSSFGFTENGCNDGSDDTCLFGVSSIEDPGDASLEMLDAGVRGSSLTKRTAVDLPNTELSCSLHGIPENALPKVEISTVPLSNAERTSELPNDKIPFDENSNAEQVNDERLGQPQIDIPDGDLNTEGQSNDSYECTDTVSPAHEVLSAEIRRENGFKVTVLRLRQEVTSSGRSSGRLKDYQGRENLPLRVEVIDELLDSRFLSVWKDKVNVTSFPAVGDYLARLGLPSVLYRRCKRDIYHSSRIVSLERIGAFYRFLRSYELKVPWGVRKLSDICSKNIAVHLNGRPDLISQLNLPTALKSQIVLE